MGDHHSFLNVKDFHASLHHLWWFLLDGNKQTKIYDCIKAMEGHPDHMVQSESDQGVIMSIQDDGFVEMHNGNASGVAWVLCQQMKGLSTSWGKISSLCVAHHQKQFWSIASIKTQESLCLLGFQEK